VTNPILSQQVCQQVYFASLCYT